PAVPACGAMKLPSLRFSQFATLTCLLSALAICVGCSTFPPSGTAEPRKGDEIVAAGQFFHTGTRVVLWMDPGGYDAYLVQRRFAPFDESSFEDSRSNLSSP